MQLISAAIRSFVRNEEGVTMVEYALMLALIAVICIGAVTLVGTGTNTTFNSSAGSL